MRQDVSFRPATAADARDCFVLSRRSMHDAMVRNGYVAADAPEPDRDAACKRHAAVRGHLAATFGQWWVAPAVSLRERRFRMEPFLCLFLADGPWCRLDRYLPFNPCLFL